MPTVQLTDHISRLGITEVEKLCVLAGQVFREVLIRDIGIDGLMEVVLDSGATGVFVAVQVKTGDSFVKGDTFSLPADRSHLLYWAGCILPVIGIVHQPSTGRTLWMDVTAACTEDRIDNGPYTLSAKFGANTELTPTTLKEQLIPAALLHLSNSGDRARARDLVERCMVRWKETLPLVGKHATPVDPVAGWAALVEFYLSPVASIDDMADTAYRLSWYLPAVDSKRVAILDRALGNVNDDTLRRMLAACGHAEEIAGEYAEHSVWIIQRVPRARKRLEMLLRNGTLSPELVSVAIRVLECIQERERNDLRRLYKVD